VVLFVGYQFVQKASGNRKDEPYKIQSFSPHPRYLYDASLRWFVWSLFICVKRRTAQSSDIHFYLSRSFFLLFCMFYCLYFNAKALKAAEWQRPVTFSDFAGEFFMIWFFPVGIWILQPRINKLFENKSGTPNDSLPGY